MNYYKYDILFQEVPNEISLAFYFTGCPLRCKGCHSPELWNSKNGSPLTCMKLESLLKQYHGYISCVLFMGGDWNQKELLLYSQCISNYSELSMALFTGKEMEEINPKLLDQLTYIKTGPWIEERGGLDSPFTNQKFYNLKT